MSPKLGIALITVFLLGLLFPLAVMAQQSTSGPEPPPGLERVQREPTRTQVVLTVPAYLWHNGCGPTAVGMVVGYYDNLGWDDLVPGEIADDSPEAQQMIASHGSVDYPAHYEDYVLPQDGGLSTPSNDKSEPPVGDEHASNSVADFMHASWSADGLLYGWSYSNMAGPAAAV